MQAKYTAIQQLDVIGLVVASAPYYQKDNVNDSCIGVGLYKINELYQIYERQNRNRERSNVHTRCYVVNS